MLRKLAVLAILVTVPGALYACSSDDNNTAPTPGTDAAGGADTSSNPDGGGGPDSAKPDTSVATRTVRCTQAEFDAPCTAPGGGSCLTSTQVDVSFPTTGAPAQYVNRCVKVKVGTKIDFAGSFASHPLQPQGGDTPTPIVLTNGANSPPVGTSGMPELIITMSTAGTYGFECQLHPDSMFGAIQVVP